MSLSNGFLSSPLAHRGLHDVADGRPENSRAAIEAAIKAGYGIEIDVVAARDAVPMVFHDAHLERLSRASGLVNTYDADALSQITLLGNDEAIPTLREILSLVAGRAPLLIEIKDHTANLGPGIAPFAQDVARVLQGYEGPLAVMSFNPHAMRQMALDLPNIPRGLVTSRFRKKAWPTVPPRRRKKLRAIKLFDAIGASFISHKAADLDLARVAELKAQGSHILCWTIKSKTQEQEVRTIADNITFEQYLA